MTTCVSRLLTWVAMMPSRGALNPTTAILDLLSTRQEPGSALGSKIDADLRADGQRVGNGARARGPDDVLDVRLDADPHADEEHVVQLDDGLVALRRQTRGGEAHVVLAPEPAGSDGEARPVPWAAGEEPLVDEPGVEVARHRVGPVREAEDEGAEGRKAAAATGRLAVEHLVRKQPDHPVAGGRGVPGPAEILELAGQVEPADLVDPRQGLVRVAVHVVSDLARQRDAVAAESPPRAVQVLALARRVAPLPLRVTVVDRSLESPVARWGVEGCPQAPRRERVGGEGEGVLEEDRLRAAAEGVVEELAVEVRPEEVVVGDQPTVGQVESVVHKPGRELHVHQFEGLTAVELLDREGVSPLRRRDEARRHAVAIALRHLHEERGAGDADEPVQVEPELEGDVVGVGPSELLTPRNVAHGLRRVVQADGNARLLQAVSGPAPAPGQEVAGWEVRGRGRGRRRGRLRSLRCVQRRGRRREGRQGDRRGEERCCEAFEKLSIHDPFAPEWHAWTRFTGNSGLVSHLRY